MRVFTIDNQGKLIPYKEYPFRESNRESELEQLLENNPEYFFEDSKLLIIGRQVTTNLNTFIDLLGIDKNGNTVVVELKRGKTPRETIAQLLEYASFAENLDYSQLNDIYQDYSGEDVELEDFHKEYFNKDAEEAVSFNKSVKLVIVAEDISKEISQTALFLRKKGIDIFCIEFKYFQTETNQKIISSNFVIGEDRFIRSEIQSASLPKIDKNQFLNSLDDNGLKVFDRIFAFASENNLLLRWGSRGFSLNYRLDDGFVSLIFGYPPSSVYKQSVYTGFEYILKKIADSESIVELYKKKINEFGKFKEAGINFKWMIDKNYSEEEIQSFIDILSVIIQEIKKITSESGRC